MTDYSGLFEDLPEPIEAALKELLDRAKDSFGTDNFSDAEMCALLAVYYEENGLRTPYPVQLEGGAPSGISSILNPQPARLNDRSIDKVETRWHRTLLAYQDDILDRWNKLKRREARQAIDKTKGETFGYARLTGDEKEMAHGHLKKIRELIEESELADRKKNKLFERINDLSRELDRNGTHTDRFFAFSMDMAFVSGQMAERAKPALDELKEFLRIIWRARQRTEGVALPGPEDFPQLPPQGEE